MISNLLSAPQTDNMRNIVRYPSNYQMLPRINSILTQFNESVISLQTESILAVNEATNERLENKTIAKYFEDFATDIDSLAKRINEQKSKFAINFQIFEDANGGISADIPTVVDSETKYTKTVYKNLDNGDFPRISPKGVFKHEYKLIGKALQDLSDVSDTNAKIAAIAAIYDSLIKSMSGDWSEKCAKAILQDNYDDDCKDFIKCAYNSFVCGAKEITISQDEVLRAVYTITQSKIVAQQIQDSFDVLLTDLLAISDELRAIFIGNQTNSVDIKTDANGVIDKTYVLSDKAMSKMNQIIKAKTNQVSEVVNLYLITLAIKCDCFMKSIRQARDIIDIACFGQTSTGTSSEDDEHTTIEDSTDDLDSDDDTVGDDNLELDDQGEGEEDVELGDPNEGTGDDLEQNPDDDAETTSSDVEQSFEEECYLFETAVSRMMLIESELNMYQMVQQAILEADPAPATKPQQNQTNTQTQQRTPAQTKSSEISKKLDSMREKMNEMIANLINKLRSLVQKFVDVFINKNKKKIEFVKNNQKTILQNGANGGGTIIEYNVEAIKKMQVNVEYSTNRQYLDKEENFVTKVLGYEMKEGESLSEVLTKSVIGEGETVEVTKAHVQTAINYIVNEFQGIVKSVQDAQNKLTVKSKNAKIEAKRYATTNEAATLESTLFTYFTEADFDAPDNAVNTKKEISDNRSDVTKQLMLMYKINGVLLSTKMSLAQKAFNTYYSMCAFFASNYVGDGDEQSEEQEEKQEEKTEEKQEEKVAGASIGKDGKKKSKIGDAVHDAIQSVKNKVKKK